MRDEAAEIWRIADGMRTKEVIDKAKAFADKVDRVCKSPEFNGVWILAATHGMKYCGESWVKEFDELKEAIEKYEGENK